MVARVARPSSGGSPTAPSSGGRLAAYFDTHPLHADRIAALAAEAAAHGWATDGKLTPLAWPRTTE